MNSATSRFTGLILLSGEDSPGTIDKLLQTLAPFSITVIDSNLLTIRGRLVYSLLIELNPDHQAAISADLDELGDSAGLDIAVEFSAYAVPYSELTSYEVSAVSQSYSVKDLALISAHINNLGGKISHFNASTYTNFLGINLRFLAGKELDLKAFSQTLNLPGVALIIRAESKKGPGSDLLLLDMDSTFINEEVIDLLADIAGVGAQVSEITDRAMAGEIDFVQSLEERVALLKGLSTDAFADIRGKMNLTEGAAALVRTVKAHGGYVGIVSGGFHEVIDDFLAPLQLDLIEANHFEIIDGILTGKLYGPIVDASRKAQVLKEFAELKSVRMAQTVAVGDGANDALMVEQAGLGIAFCAKPALKLQADVAIDVRDLTAVLALIGYSLTSISR